MLNWVIAAAAAATVACPKGEAAAVPPSWLEKPTVDAMRSAYPSKAADLDIPGSAIIACETNPQGKTENCKVISETPRGYGFGEAALVLAAEFKFSPKIQCGIPVRGTVKVPLNFVAPSKEAAEAKPLSPEALSLADRLIVASRRDRGLDLWLAEELERMARVEAKGADLTVEQRIAARAAAKETWDSRKDALRDGLVQSYAQVFTVAQLREAVSFFEGPVGQAMNIQDDRTSALIANTILSQKIKDDFRGRYCAKVTTCQPTAAK